MRCERFGRMKTKYLKLTAIVALLSAFAFSSGCRTVEGAGKDIEHAGEGIQNAAR